VWCVTIQKDTVPEDYFCRDPDHRSIYRFIRNLFHSAQLTAECAIVTLVSQLSVLFTLSISNTHNHPVVCAGVMEPVPVLVLVVSLEIQ